MIRSMKDFSERSPKHDTNIKRHRKNYFLCDTGSYRARVGGGCVFVYVCTCVTQETRNNVTEKKKLINYRGGTRRDPNVPKLFIHSNKIFYP